MTSFRIYNVGLLILFSFLSLEVKSQDAEAIIQKHLRSTSQNSWQDITTIYEEGVQTSNEEEHQFKSWKQFPNLFRLELTTGEKKSVSVENGEIDDFLIKNGLPKFPLPFISNSFALSKQEFYNLFVSKMPDTIFGDIKTHRIKVSKKTEFFNSNSIYYFDDINFYLRRVECIDPQNILTIDFSDFKMINGYLFPFASKTKRFNKDYSTTTISVIRINEEFKSGTFDSQRE